MSNRLAILLLGACTLASKCFTHDSEFDLPADDGGGGASGAMQNEGGAGGAGGGEGGAGGSSSSFVPAIACTEPGTARLDVAERAFSIRCGCLEADGKTCTIAVSTAVTWTFLDSEEHNVTSVFGDSPDKLSGTYKRTFDAPGEYSYGCSIHASMKNYRIIVIEAP